MIVFSPRLCSTLLDLRLCVLVVSKGPLTEMVTGGIWMQPRTFLVNVTGASFLGLVDVAGLNEGRFPTDLRSLAGTSFSRRIVVDAVEENGF